MTEKRFTYEYDEYNGNLFDNKYGTFYLIEDSEENIGLLCKRLNALHEKNEQSKSELKALRKKYNDFSDMVEQRLKQMDMGLVK